MDQLVSWEEAVRFRHPLMRSAVYYAAPAVDRHRVHEALAAACDPVLDPDRRAWHLAEATLQPDEQVAAELERSATRARGRGGWASGAAFLERSADLTPDEPRRARRLLDAAEARFVAGEALAVLDLVERAAVRLADPVVVAQARRLEGLSLYAAGDVARATTVLLDAAAMTGPDDARLARDILLDAIVTAHFTGPADTARVLGMAAELPLPDDASPTLTDLLLDGFAAVGEGRHADGAALLRQAVGPLSGNRPLPDDVLRYFLPVSMAASMMFDDSAWHELEHRWVAELREPRRARSHAGGTRLGRLQPGGGGQVRRRGGHHRGGTNAERGNGVPCSPRALHVRGAQPSWPAAAGRPLPARSPSRCCREFAARGYGLGLYWAQSALCQLEIGLGNYDDALRIAMQSGLRAGSTVDLIEAGTRSGDTATAVAALGSLAPMASAAGTPAALGWLALGQAMIAPDGPANEGAADDNAAGGPVPTGHRASRAQPVRARASPGPAAVRGVAAPTAPSARRPRPAQRRL